MDDLEYEDALAEALALFAALDDLLQWAYRHGNKSDTAVQQAAAAITHAAMRLDVTER